MRRSPTSEEARCSLIRMIKWFNLSEGADTVCTGVGVLVFIGQKMELLWGWLPVDVFFVVSSLNKISGCCHYCVDLPVRQVC